MEGGWERDRTGVGTPYMRCLLLFERVWSMSRCGRARKKK